MIYVGAQVIFYALVAAASPLVLAATFLVIRSDKPRRRGIAFLSGFVIGTIIACVMGLFLGMTFVERLDSHDKVKVVVTLLLGIALLVVGMRARRATEPAQPRSSRASAILASLGNVGPAATFSMAGLLGFGGPKRLVLTFLAMASVSEASIRYIFDLTLVAMYLVVSTALVSVPVVLVVIAGERAAVVLARGQTWLVDHATQLRVWLSLGLGAALVVDALLHLLL